MRRLLAGTILIILLTAASHANAAPLPDAAPQAHGRHVTLVPRCPDALLPWNVTEAYLERIVNGVVVCASREGNRFTATMTF
jgi:hypothetical protein